jgi:hypothetical protein
MEGNSQYGKGPFLERVNTKWYPNTFNNSKVQI